MKDEVEDNALERNKDFERIAEELFEVDRTGIVLQGAMSLLVASVASIGSYIVTDLDPVASLLVFFITFLPNFGLKVLAEYIKKRSLVQGLQRGYKKGRKDSLLSDSEMTDIYRWAKVYLTLDSACFSHGDF